MYQLIRRMIRRRQAVRQIQCEPLEGHQGIQRLKHVLRHDLGYGQHQDPQNPGVLTFIGPEGQLVTIQELGPANPEPPNNHLHG